MAVSIWQSCSRLSALIEPGGLTESSPSPYCKAVKEVKARIPKSAQLPISELGGIADGFEYHETHRQNKWAAMRHVRIRVFCWYVFFGLWASILEGILCYRFADAELHDGFFPTTSNSRKSRWFELSRSASG